MMIEKDVYVVQPYKVGTKSSTSLAIIIPSIIVKSHKIDPSTIFIIRKENGRKIIMEKIDIADENVVVSADKSLAASSQQIHR